MELLTARQMREVDRHTIEDIGIPGVVLMENAGRAVADALCRRFEYLRPGPVLVLAGKGNNGGDGYVAARHLCERGWLVQTVVLAAKDDITGDAAVFLKALMRSAAPVHFVAHGSWAQTLSGLEEPVLLVDALLGTGLSSEVRGVYGEVIDWVNDCPAPAVAVDISSGIDASSGRVLGRAVLADLTVTFAFAKYGHASYPGAGYAAELVVADIGIPPQAGAGDGRCVLVEAADAAALLPQRPGAGHKGSFGHLLVIAGACGTSGAAAMTARGAQRSGAGLVTVGCPQGIHDILEVKLTEAMTAALPEIDGCLSLQAFEDSIVLSQGKQALALGPGIGTAEETAQLVRRLIRSCVLPMVIDADGLNALAGHLDCLKDRGKAETVLTPHPGEMARLTGMSVSEVEADRLNVARDFAAAHDVVVLLKGARTVVAGPEGAIRLNSTGNSGLASGGMGDVLTGLIGGLIGQGLSGLDAASLAAYLHGHAADRIAARQGEAGMTAGDLLRELPVVRSNLLARENSKC